MGLTCSQQARKPRCPAERGIQRSRYTAANAFRWPDRCHSIFAPAIRLARRRAKRSPNSKSAARALYAKSIFILRPATIFAHRFARKNSRLMTASCSRLSCHPTRRDKPLRKLSRVGCTDWLGTIDVKCCVLPAFKNGCLLVSNALESRRTIFLAPKRFCRGKSPRRSGLVPFFP